MKKIIVIGSVNIDYNIKVNNIPKIGETILGENFIISYGGKGINQAFAAYKLGANVLFYGALGNDYYGKEYLNIIKEEKLPNIIKITETSSGSAFINIDKNGNNNIVVVPGANYEITKKDIDEVFKNNDFDIVVLQLEIPVEVVIYTLKKAKQHNKITILNPAPAIKFESEYYKYIDYFIPNETEIKVYANNLSDLLEKGIKNIIITKGEIGAILINKTKEKLIPTVKVKAVDTVGAGDCFVGAFANAIAKNYELEQAIEFANKAASYSVTQKGTFKSYPTLKDINN